ncbi:Crp/Fnr family transcriptional regulator [Vineibacter terrae]|uniref:Crp/Fnr family transcriptional regulator n=1 Tax=Vineibacter terrae TaxID=2586908 RepID=UPI002E36B405|nr:Crp/Fnr family transcriptional regulator [Vineibacter terrae]HEX2886465.1 Crp/Fnr family transcriptional regulator [Vineibacter terrae]
MSVLRTPPVAGTADPSGLPASRVAAGALPCNTCAARQFSICAPVSDADLPHFFAMSVKLRFEPRRYLFDEGDAPRYVFSIASGTVCLSKALSDGRRQITGFLFEGDFIGLAHGETCAYTAEALTPVEVCRFPRDRFERYMTEHPHVERRLLQIASTELAAAQDQMLLLGRKTATERVASFLIRLSDRAVAHGRSGNPVCLPMTRAEIGDYLGLTLETVSRTMTQLRKRGAIDLDNTSVVRLTSEETLRRLAGV